MVTRVDVLRAAELWVRAAAARVRPADHRGDQPAGRDGQDRDGRRAPGGGDPPVVAGAAGGLPSGRQQHSGDQDAGDGPSAQEGVEPGDGAGHRGVPEARRVRRISRPTGSREIRMIAPTTGSKYRSIPGTFSPRRYPVIVRPTDQASPLVICQRVKVRAGIPTIPASGLSTVRTTGTNRARVIAFPWP